MKKVVVLNIASIVATVYLIILNNLIFDNYDTLLVSEYLQKSMF